MTDKPYTDADVELVAEAAYESDNYDTHGGWYKPWADVHKRVRHEYERGAGKALDALATAGRLANGRPTPHLDAVKAELDRAREDLAAMTEAALGHRATAGKALSELARLRAERDAACALVVELLRSEQTADAPLGSPADHTQEQPCFDCGQREADHVDGRCSVYRPAETPASHAVEQDADCTTCSGPVRETVGMVCQTCGTDYSTREG